MKSTAVIIGMLLASTTASIGQSTTGPSPQLPEPYASKDTTKSSKLVPFSADKGPLAPAGFKVNRFAEGLNSPRQLLVLPNGDVLAAEAKTERKPNDPAYRDKGANRIRLLRDVNGDGIADINTIMISGLRQPYGMAYLKNRLYIADTDGVFWVPYRIGQTTLKNDIEKHLIAAFKPGGYNNHWTRNLIISPDGRFLYVAIGSASNAGEYGPDEEIRRANILRIDLKNGKEIVFASGLRNPVGMAFEPETGALWTVVNERDHLGDDLVPDYMTSVKQDAFYGWPYSYFGQNEDPRLKGQRSDLVAKAIAPDYALGAHVAPLGIAFGRDTKFPQKYRNGAFVARHGSWNRSELAGYDVVFVPFDKGIPSGDLQPFLTGFIIDEDRVHGRPRSLMIAKDGSLLLADDSTGIIWRISAQ